ncbi:head maturation protease, ClpP-related [Micromonospora peucetia]|uniref:ATP-dependent Clp protease proteolytic subunit n=1 Tax=Micromonospora peucetia TaxID=47871 RepID=A0ABZ1EJU8_9ACTN|nr:head maturation protease, ClpP-related [Micromonospora peucetia]WSA34542.1 ATP-dependent Clp protease proteolytic subunit [Micromonospora peucetia]
MKLRDLRRPEPARASSRRAQALAAGEPPASWYRIGPVVAAAVAPVEGADQEAAEATSADVYVYDTIGGWFGMTADDFVRDVASLDVDEIRLHLNSPGGDVFEAVAMANVLRQHRARVIVMVDGLAASAGTVVAMAGDEVVMGVGSQMMIHDAWGYCIGNAADMEKTAQMLATTSDSIASTYAARTGGSTEDWRALMRAETWYTADEAVTVGLADRVATDDDKGTASGEQVTPGGGAGSFWDLWDTYRSQDRFDLSAFAYAGRSNAPAPAIPAAGPSTEQEGSRAVAFSDEQLNNLRQRLNVADDADEATILAALNSALAERPAPPQSAPGTVVLDEAQHAQLLADARDGREARAQQLREQREATVQAAVRDGRIPPARAEHWMAQLEADPGAAETLAALKPGLVPVNEIGYTADKPADPAATDDYWFAGAGAPGRKEG